MGNWQEYLESIYFNPLHPGAFSGPAKLYKVVKREKKHVISLNNIKQWLQDQDAYSLQKPVRYKFKRNKVVSKGLDSLWDMDLADVSNIEDSNKGVKFLLIVIDIFSRYLWVAPLANKKHTTVINGLKKVFSHGRKPQWLRSDPGGEFANRWMKAFLKKEGVRHFVTHNETKANYAERVIRTLKVLMYRYFTRKQSREYKPILQDLVHNYNNRPHSSLNGRNPVDINAKNEAVIWKEQYVDSIVLPKTLKAKKYKHNIDDLVRLPHLKRPFQRDYDEKWTEEIFIVKSRKFRSGIPIYKVTDFDNDPIQGTFYENELQMVNKSRDDLWRVENVIKKRKVKGKEEWFVSFAGWPKKFNMWLPRENIFAYNSK